MGKDADGICPYLEQDDPRCMHRLTLRQIDEVFDYCICHPQACRIHREIAADQTGTRIAELRISVA